MMPFSEEEKLLETRRAVVCLVPSNQEVADAVPHKGDFSSPKYEFQPFTNKLRESEFSRCNESNGQIECGDIGEFVFRKVSLQSLTLTKKNLVFSYKKGLFNKKNLRITIPLEFAVSIEEKKLPKHLEIRYVVPKEDDELVFDVWLGHLEDTQAWLQKLNQVIKQNTTSKQE